MASLITVVGTTDAPPFHEALLRLRVFAEMSHRDVGQRVGVKPALVAQWETGGEIPTPRQFARLRNVCFRELRVYRRSLADHWKGRGEPQAEIDGANGASASHEVDAPGMEPAAVAPPAVVVTAPARPQDADTFGQALRRARILEGVSRNDLADMMRVDDGSVSNWELNKCIPIRAHHHQLLDLFPVLTECPPPSKGLPRDIPKPGPELGVMRSRGAAGAIVTDAPAPPLAPPADPRERLRSAGSAYAEALAVVATAEADERAANDQAERAQVAADQIVARAQEAAERIVNEAIDRRDEAARRGELARGAATERLAELQSITTEAWRTP